MTEDERRIKDAIIKRGYSVLVTLRDLGVEFTIVDPKLEKHHCRCIISKNRFPSRYREGEYKAAFAAFGDNPAFSTTFTDADEVVTYIESEGNYLNS